MIHHGHERHPHRTRPARRPYRPTIGHRIAMAIILGLFVGSLVATWVHNPLAILGGVGVMAVFETVSWRFYEAKDSL